MALAIPMQGAWSIDDRKRRRLAGFGLLGTLVVQPYQATDLGGLAPSWLRAESDLMH